VEPVFVLISPVFWLWDDVRALLILQAAALAAGAWPIYLLARRHIANRKSQMANGSTQYAPRTTHHATADWLSLIFAAAYLLTPALQAGAVAEFHAFPFAAPLIAWALWAVEDRRWGELVVAGVLLAGVQEGMALLTATLGLYAIARGSGEGVAEAKGAAGWTRGFSRFGARATDRLKARFLGFSPPALAAGVAMATFGLAWFYVATFVIIPHYASLAYGLAQSPYAARFGALGDSFGDVAKALLTQPLTVLQIAVEPLRLRYLAGLLWPSAFLALLGPEIVLLSLPLLLANLLSGFPFQYSGELHYSTPLVPFFSVATIFGCERLLRRGVRGQGAGGRRLSPVSWPLIAALCVALAGLGYQIAAGYLPIGREFWRQGWPQATAHDRLLDRFAAQIPPDAALSVATDLYPHLSHRERIYQFPRIGEAAWALVDVSGTTDRHPNDVQAAIRKLLVGGWGIVDAADGYILLAQGLGGATIPDAFYDFARMSKSLSEELAKAAPTPPVAGMGAASAVFRRDSQPQYPLDITFGDRLKLLGYDVLDDVKWRRTSLRFYWQALAPLPPDAAISVQVLTPEGGVADDTAVRPMPALLWYPSSRWQVGETVVVETLPWYLPREWAPVVEVEQRIAADKRMSSVARDQPRQAAVSVTPDGRVLLPAWTRRDGALIPLVDPHDPFQIAARFTGKDWSVRLTGWAAAMAVAPGKELPVALHWQAAGPAAKDYTVFLHLRDATGKTVATGDGTPTWFLPRPTSGWPAGGIVTWDGHRIAVPADLPAGRYDLVAGWYDWQTSERLNAYDENGNLVGNEFVLGPVTIDLHAGPRPDLACLLAVESCASLE
jgi:uncharacterized membrane protein